MPPQAFPWVYPYEEERRVQGTEFLRKPFLRPLVLVRMGAQLQGAHNLVALVDTGCDHVVASPWIAQDIGVEPDVNREITVRIGGAPRRVRFADVSISLLPPETPIDQGSFDRDSAHEWHTQIGFFTEWQSPPWSVVLGQVGFLDQFTVTFNRESRALAVTAIEDFDERFPQRPPRESPPPPRFRV